MTEVDFYILDLPHRSDQWDFTCRLVEKAVYQGNKVMIATDDKETSEKLDHLLWSFKPESFIPHGIQDQTPEDVPVLISHGGDNAHHHDVLVNIGLQLPQYFSRFNRLVEIVVQEESVLQATRNNYTYYKERGYPIRTHKITGVPTGASRDR